MNGVKKFDERMYIFVVDGNLIYVLFVLSTTLSRGQNVVFSQLQDMFER
jgi:hypothetical protein